MHANCFTARCAACWVILPDKGSCGPIEPPTDWIGIRLHSAPHPKGLTPVSGWDCEHTELLLMLHWGPGLFCPPWDRSMTFSPLSRQIICLRPSEYHCFSVCRTCCSPGFKKVFIHLNGLVYTTNMLLFRQKLTYSSFPLKTSNPTRHLSTVLKSTHSGESIFNSSVTVLAQSRWL